MAGVYGAGAAMGFTPQQVNAMSMWQFFAAAAGFAEANSPQDGPQLSADEADELYDWIEAGDQGPRTLTTAVYAWDGDRFEVAGRVSFVTD